MSTTRRNFLKAGLASGAALTLGSSSPAIEPINRLSKPHLRLSLAAYSFRKYLDLKKPTMTLPDYIDLAASYDIDAVEPTSYYFPDTSDEFLAKLKGQCTRLGLDISGSAIRNDFCVANLEELDKEIDHVKKWAEIVSRLGGKTVRIFAGRLPKGGDEMKVRNQVIAAIEQACDHAGKFGVYLALENHGGITERVDQILAIIKGVNHPWFGVNLDSGNFHSDDPYGDLEKIAPYAVNAQIKTEIKPAGKKAEQADLSRLIDILRKANYRGYVALEYEAGEEPKQAVPRYLDVLKKLVR